MASRIPSQGGDQYQTALVGELGSLEGRPRTLDLDLALRRRVQMETKQRVSCEVFRGTLDSWEDLFRR